MSSEGNRVALIVACDRYADPDLKELQAPSQDAEHFARILKDPNVGNFKVVTSLINEPYYTIREKIDEFLQSCNREDTILLYFSCHGIKDKNGQLYFATITTNRKRLFSTGIESNFVNKILDQCRAQQKIVLLDCCYSGAFEKGRDVRADEKVNATEFFGEGSVVITASDAMQYAFEGDDKKELGRGGSYFTNALIEGLETGKADANNDGNITYSELYNYIYDHVRRITPDQTPTLNTRGVKGDFEIFKNIGDNLGSSEAEASAVRRPDYNTMSHQRIDPFYQYIQEARTLLEEEQYDEAIQIFNSILTLKRSGQEQGHLEALNGKGLALYKQKKYKEALGCFNEVLTLKSKHPEARTYVEFINEKISKERMRKAKGYGKDVKQDMTALEKRTEEKVKKALTDSTQIPSELIKKGDEFLEKRKYRDAIIWYDQALEIEPHSESAWYSKGKGLALYNLKKHKEAIQCFDKALEINPKFDTAWSNKGSVLSILGRYKEAMKCYDKALKIYPNYSIVWSGEGNAHIRLGRTKETSQWRNKAKEQGIKYFSTMLE